MISAVGNQYIAGEYANAATLARDYLHEPDPDVKAVRNIGEIAFAYQDYDTALRAYEFCVGAMPDDANLRNRYAALLILAGDFEAARKHADEALARGGAPGGTYFNIAQIHKATSGDPVIPAIETLLKDGLSRGDEYACRLALGKLYDDIGEYDAAFFEIATAKRMANAQFDRAAQTAYVDRLRRVFSRDFMQAAAGTGYEIDAPIFIVGMPRTGSSLFECLLAAAGDAATLGERVDMTVVIENLCRRNNARQGYLDILGTMDKAEYAACGREYCARLTPLAGDNAKFIDKNLLNFPRIGFIHLALPNAGVVHTRRHPLDACLSIYFQALNPANFGFSFDLADLGAYYVEYARMMSHWRDVCGDRLCEVDYEKLVANPSAEIARARESLRLAPREGAAADSVIATSSAWQARQPVNEASIGRWKPYERHLAALIDTLAGAGLLPGA